MRGRGYHSRARHRDVVRERDPRWKRWLKRFFMGLGILVFTGMMLGVITRMLVKDGAALPSSFILTMEMTGSLNEGADRLSYWAPAEDDFYRVLATLHHGAKDPHVKALIARIWTGQYSISQIREIRAALNEWRAAGKPTYAYSVSLGDGGSGMDMYWLATAFDKIWVQPTGFVTVNGFRAQAPYLRDLLNKHGITPEFFSFTTYKTVMDIAMRSSMRDADKEQLGEMLNGLSDAFVNDVAAARSLPEDKVRELMRGAPYTAEMAARNGLIDNVGYDDELGARLRLGLRDDSMAFVPVADYLPSALESLQKRKGGVRVAMINIEGEIAESMTMPEDAQPRHGPLAAPEQCIPCAIVTAADDQSIAAILLRINSPGGSPSASETIRHAIIVARAKGKPVVVSMGDMAASGGYWIASAADKIVAQPTTVTGSIGVAGGKISTRQFFKDLGVNWDGVAANDVAPDMGSFIDPYSPEAAQRNEQLLASIYEAFKARVAQGRGIKDVEAIAKGRVWLGAKAKEIGLIDELGGLDQAKNTLAIRMNLKSADDVSLIAYARPVSPLAGLRRLIDIPRAGIAEWHKLQVMLNRPMIETREPLTGFLQDAR